jgi:hypothetical protein
VELRNSAVAQSMALAGKPVCHLYAGLFAGAFSFYDKTGLFCFWRDGLILKKSNSCMIPCQIYRDTPEQVFDIKNTITPPF